MENNQLTESLIQRALDKIDALVESTSALTIEMRNMQYHWQELKQERNKSADAHAALVTRVEVLEKFWGERNVVEKVHLVWIRRIGLSIIGIGGFLGWLFNFFHGKLLLQWISSHVS